MDAGNGCRFCNRQSGRYDLDKNFTKDVKVIHNQDEALKDADFIYVKNWSSFDDYAAMPEVKDNWMLTNEKLENTNQAKVMHCLPVRRNVELSDEGDGW
jgi:N-succinyl-L-ornithine transcarbamylase